ncbi:hypothetical protein DM02DRAFT_627754 [Periconia macrospinosa]|uniref:Uncharacterized protein n=1 Tax=Periconia macrospinosa TaxID=97972 RepID=A0A2V1DWX7_9PLEO|nr:hypothetical protein DM02DRAFT_627754 [Periconia macrospinosa]
MAPGSVDGRCGRWWTGLAGGLRFRGEVGWAKSKCSLRYPGWMERRREEASPETRVRRRAMIFERWIGAKRENRVTGGVGLGRVKCMTMLASLTLADPQAGKDTPFLMITHVHFSRVLPYAAIATRPWHSWCSSQLNNGSSSGHYRAYCIITQAYTDIIPYMALYRPCLMIHDKALPTQEHLPITRPMYDFGVVDT